MVKALARERNKQRFWTNLVLIVNVHAILQVPTEIIPHCSKAHFEIDSNMVEQQSQGNHFVPKLMVSQD